MRRVTHLILLIALLGAVTASGCAPRASLIALQPAQIDTTGISKVAVGSFEVIFVSQTTYLDRKGKWKSYEDPLTPEQKKALGRQVRAQVINSLSTTPYFKLVYTDEFSKLENDADFQKLVGATGYQSQEVDAVINGKVWVDYRKIKGAEVAKSEMRFVQGGDKKKSLDISVEKLIWWPYQSLRGKLVLEVKLTRLAPTEVVSVVVDERGFSHQIGGAPKEGLEKVGESYSDISSYLEKQQLNQSKVENSDLVLPTFEQLVADLAQSVASEFVRKIAVTEKRVNYPIALSGDTQGIQLIRAGAYDMAIEKLQSITAAEKKPADLYNLGLCFEATGDYGLARVFYKDAHDLEPTDLIFAQGLGRIERNLRENPRLKRQLAEKNDQQ